MSATSAYQAPRPAWGARGDADSARAFRLARRHSRLVRALRIGIPLTVAGAIVLNVLADWLLGSAGVNLPALGTLGISGSKITMDRPRVSGYTRDGRAYELHAQSAAQDLKTPQIIELQSVRTKMQLRDSGSVVITADNGTYDSRSEIVSLRQNVRTVTSDGTEIRLSEVTVDVRQGHVISQKPVEVVQPRAQINANAMEIVDSGAVVYFRGGVRFTAAGDGFLPQHKPGGESR